MISKSFAFSVKSASERHVPQREVSNPFFFLFIVAPLITWERKLIATVLYTPLIYTPRRELINIPSTGFYPRG